jgi:MFS transporter, DHA1 family, multidrug resistance protein
MTKEQKLLLICQFLMMLSLEMSNPFLPSYVQSLSGASLHFVFMQSSFVLAIPMIMMIVTSPIWGSLADRYGYKPMLLRASAALVITQLLTSMATSPLQLMIIRAMQGGFAGFLAAMQAYAVNLTPWEHKGKYLARLESAKALGTCVSGVIGGLIVSLSAIRDLFLLSSGICIIVTVIIYVTLPEVKKCARKPSMPHQTHLVPHFSIIACFIFLSQVAKFIPNPTFSIYVETFVQKSPLIIGLLYSLPAVSLILMSEFSGRLFDFIRKNKPQAIFPYFFGVALLGFIIMTAHSATHSVIGLILIRFLWGVVFASLLPALFALISDYSSKSGYYIGIANSFTKLGNFSGLMLGGFGAGILALNQIFLLAGLSYFFIMIISLLHSWKTLSFGVHNES